MAKTRRTQKGGGGAGGLPAFVLLIGVLLLAGGIGGLLIKESWAPSSRSGGRVSGSTLGLDPWGPHKPPFSARSLLMPHPSYEYSLDPAHGTAHLLDRRHLNEPNVLSFPHAARHQHPTRDIAPISQPGSMLFARSHHDTLGDYTPQQQRFYVKNRLGDPSYSVHPDYTVPTFGVRSGFRRVGIVFQPNHPDLRLPLFGRPKYPGGNRFDYYVLDESPHANPLELEDHNGLELVNDDVVRLPGYSGDFFVHIYSPQYQQPIGLLH